MGFVCGTYLIGFNSKICGQTQEGLVFDRQIFKRLISGDWMGEAAQDAIYRGMDVTSMCTFLEADAAAMNDIIRPYNANGLQTGDVIGILDVQHGVAKSLVLTSLLTSTNINANGGTGASSVLPLTRTAARTALAENYPVRELFGNNLRDVPVKFRHYPSARTQSTGLGGGVYATET